MLLLAACALGCGGGDDLRLRPQKPPEEEPKTLCGAKTLEPWSRKTLGVGGAVSFNEILYHPAGDAKLEWIELYNPFGIDIDMSGFRLDGAVQFTFPSGTMIHARDFILVAADADLLAKAVGAPVAVGSYAGELPDNGGTVELWNNGGRRLDSITYTDVEPWPVIPDGSGASLAKRTAGASSERAEEWSASALVGGSPGAANPDDKPAPGLELNEVAGATVDALWVEIANSGPAAIDAGGYVLTSSANGSFILPPHPLAPGELLLVDQAELGFGALAGDKLFLFKPDGSGAIDGIEIKSVPRGRSGAAGGAWRYPDVATPGAPNEFIESDRVVIHEIMYHAAPVKAPDGSLVKSPLEWLELTNLGPGPADVGGFQLVDAIAYEIPAGVVVPENGYLVIANDAEAMKAAYPAPASSSALVGDFKSGLADSGETITLLDACGNAVDTVRYEDGGRWPSSPDGGGASLELRDPRADNTAPEAWSASDEAKSSAWQTVTYEGVASPSSLGPDGVYQEFILGLLDAGEVLIDDISVVENPAGSPAELISGGSFEGDLPPSFRLLGNHRHSEVIADPTDPANHVLRVVATGPTEHMHNHIETTVAGGSSIKNGAPYRISYRAKWVAGSNQVNTRLYFNRLPKTTEIARTKAPGTPGAANSRGAANVGPTYSDLRHAPVVPKPSEPVLVSVTAQDPDGVAGLTLWYAEGGGPASSVVMKDDGGGRFSAMVPGGQAGSVHQFYVTGKDAIGAESSFPAAGPASRALFQVDDGLAVTPGLRELRLVMLPEDAKWLFAPINVMSNDHLAITVIDDEADTFYDVGVRLKGSERGRNEVPRVGFGLRFPPDHLFRGIHASVLVDRSEGVNFGQRELFFNQAMNHAGSVTSHYDDLVAIITPRPEINGSAHIQTARFGDRMLDAQFEDGGDGMLFEYELIYYPLTTDNGTPQGNKLPQPDSVVGVPIQDLGDDKESYRLPFIIKNNRWRDDYRGLIQFAKVFGLSGAEFAAKVGDVIDVDQWLRAFAFGTLSGAIDNYASAAQHNGDFYVRPTDGRALFFPHDLDFYGGSPQSPVIWSPDLARLIAVPARARAYYGHVYDIISTSYNAQYMAHWANHLGGLLPAQNFAGHLQFVAQRAAWMLTAAPDAVMNAIPPVAFSITTNGGAPFSVTTPTVTLDGIGWIDVHEVKGAPANAQVALTWLNQTAWQATLDVSCGANTLTLDAFDRHGKSVGSDTLSVTRSGAGCP